MLRCLGQYVETIKFVYYLKHLLSKCIFHQIQKTIKKTARREQLMREETEQKRLKTVLELQYILDKLGDDEVRSDLKQGTNGVSILTETELSTLDEFYKLVEPERDMNIRYMIEYKAKIIQNCNCDLIIFFGNIKLFR